MTFAKKSYHLIAEGTAWTSIQKLLLSCLPLAMFLWRCPSECKQTCSLGKDNIPQWESMFWKSGSWGQRKGNKPFCLFRVSAKANVYLTRFWLCFNFNIPTLKRTHKILLSNRTRTGEGGLWTIAKLSLKIYQCYLVSELEWFSVLQGYML